MRSLEKRALDSLIDQLLSNIGNHARVVGPSGSLTALDDRYVGVLKHLLLEAYPQTPEALLTSVRDDLIVVTRAIDAPSELVGFEPSTLRVTKTYSKGIDEWREMYGDLLNVTIQPTRYLDTDLHEPYITFHESFFAPRSITGWMKLSRHFARVCNAMEDLKRLSGLKQKEVFYDHRESNLIPAQFVDNRGELLELTPV